VIQCRKTEKEDAVKYSVERLRRLYFKAALETYASGKEAGRFPDRPWVKRFTYRGEGEFSGLLYVDEYTTNGEWSGGSTMIVLDDDPTHPLWLMQYHGWCQNDDPQVLTFLKEILTTAYRESEFYGGRGRYGRTVSDDGALLYENHPTLLPTSEEFVDFMGHERIRAHGRVWQPEFTMLFWHRYQGLLLCEPE